ncbi:MAG: hypothetical protein LBJ62_06615 [Bifidobacteriaceae bacterium]|nr:hypothetical protein [Bifidobacteriaceae bacterium]
MWGIILLCLAGFLTFVGLVAMVVSMFGGYGPGGHGTSPYLVNWFFVPGLISGALFFATQAILNKK